MSRGERKKLLTNRFGFTLVELVLATLISALVIGIFSAALSISLRTWERQQTRQSDDLPSLLGFLRLQLAEFDPVMIMDEGKLRPVFQGDERSLAFATGHSVRAISKGVPVVARYLFAPESGALFYAELPLDPYHPERIQQFLQMSPGDPKSWPHFYFTEVKEFSLSYFGEGQEDAVPSLEDEAGVPKVVRVECTAREGSVQLATAMFVNSPFAKAALGQPQGKGLKDGSRRIKRGKRL